MPEWKSPTTKTTDVRKPLKIDKNLIQRSHHAEYCILIKNYFCHRFSAHTYLFTFNKRYIKLFKRVSDNKK